MHVLLKIFLAALSGVTLAMCFPPFGHSWVVWGWMMLLLPLLWSVRDKRAGLRGFGMAWVAGMAFWLINIKWLGTVTWPGAVALSSYLALYFGLFGAFAAGAVNPWRREPVALRKVTPRFVEMGRSLGNAALLGGFWCGLEWVRGFLFTGFGWNGLGVTFADQLVLAQNAEFVGVIGLSFLPVFFSAVAVQTVRRFYDQFKLGVVKSLYWDFAVAMIVIMLAFTMGTIRLAAVNGAEKIEGKVLLIQQDIPQFADKVSWEPQRILEGFVDLTERGVASAEEVAGKAIREGGQDEVVTIPYPDLVVWPEACLPAFLQMQENGPSEGGVVIEDSLDYVKSLNDFSLVLGLNEVRGEAMAHESEVYNSLILDDVTLGRQSYQKNHLVILGEYIPNLPFLRKLYYDTTGVEFGSGLSSGQNFEPLKLSLGDEVVGMIPSVCFEDTVPRVARKFIKDEAQVIVNITNDGWFGESEGAAQHFQNGLFRAIELRRPIVRCANRGVTGVVSATGSLVDPVTLEVRSLVDDEGSHFRRGFLLASVYVPKEGGVTVYAMFGDWFAALGLGMGFLWVVVLSIRRVIRARA